jgi:hypothetical protein
MEPLYFIWEAEGEDNYYCEAIISNVYYQQLDMWIYLN